MGDERLVEVLAVESAVLAELADELAADGLHDRAEQIRDALRRASDSEEAIWKLKTLVIFLRPLDEALAGRKLKTISEAIRKSRRRLGHEVDMHQRRKRGASARRFGSGEWSPPEDG